MRANAAENLSRGMKILSDNSIMYTIERKKNNGIKENQELIKLRDFLLPLLMSERGY